MSLYGVSAPASVESPTSGFAILSVRSRLPVLPPLSPRLGVDGPRREHPSLEVLEDRAIHSRRRLPRSLAVLGIVRGADARGLEPTHFDDALVEGSMVSSITAVGKWEWTSLRYYPS